MNGQSTSVKLEENRVLVPGRVYLFSPKPRLAPHEEGTRAFRYVGDGKVEHVTCFRRHWLSDVALSRLVEAGHTLSTFLSREHRS